MKYFSIAILTFMGIYFGSIIFQKVSSKINNNQNKLMQKEAIQKLELEVANGTMQKAVFSGGCFWCTEASFNPEYGVIDAVSGFFGGNTENATYENHGDHREAVQIYFSNASTSYAKLLVNYWKHIDPTQENGQFADIGHSYTTAIYYFNEEQKALAEESKKILEDSKKLVIKK